MFRFQDPGDYRRVRDTLAAAGYDDRGIAELLGTSLSSVRMKKLPVLLHRTRGGTPLETLVRLFILGVPVVRTAAAAALAPDWWVERGLLTARGDQVEATVQLRCYQGLVVAFDFHRRGGAALPPDYVMGISASSLTLAGLTIRGPNRAALDLGTGSGIQAFLAAAHSDRVVATDRNPRAAAIAAFNARLNGLDHVECREGDLFEPVAGEAFDLIVSNPPFIISPDNVFYFMHSGMTGDEVCRTIARQAPGLLTEGGYCQFLANWTVVGDEDWRRRLAGWVKGTGCDVLVLRRGSTPPDEYAAIWIETEGGEAAFATSFDAWMDYYAKLDVAAIDSGLITLRRRAGAAPGPPWFRADDAPETMAFPAGGDVARRFEAEDFLLAHRDDAALLATRFLLSPDVALDQHARPSAGAWELARTQIRRTEGLHWSGSVDPGGAELLARCNGRRPMAGLLDELAQSVGTGDRPDGAWADVVRRLVTWGFLIPAER